MKERGQFGFNLGGGGRDNVKSWESELISEGY